MELRWKASCAASCIHAAEAICRNKDLADLAFAESLTGPARALERVLHRLEPSPPQRALAWGNLAALSDSVGMNGELAKLVLIKSFGVADERAIDDLATAIASLKSTAGRHFPRLEHELTLRIGPLREQWEARGPGILRQIGKLSDERALVASAEVLVVHPMLGGGGAAHHRFNSCRIEGVLANIDPRLPETLRLAWLLSQLHADLPMFADAVTGSPLELVAGLGFVPVVLKAAENVEWAELSPASVRAAIQAWIGGPDCEAWSEIVWNWWETWSESPTRWNVALAALDRLLS